jgi:hypothetical protein
MRELSPGTKAHRCTFGTNVPFQGAGLAIPAAHKIGSSAYSKWSKPPMRSLHLNCMLSYGIYCIIVLPVLRGDHILETRNNSGLTGYSRSWENPNIARMKTQWSSPPGPGQPRERRQRQRISDPFPARVKGISADGTSFEVDTVIDNISPGCLYLRLMPCVERGAKLSVVFRLSSSAEKAASSPRAEVTGEVLRTDPRDGAWGVAFTYKLRRFYFAEDQDH